MKIVKFILQLDNRNRNEHTKKWRYSSVIEYLTAEMYAKMKNKKNFIKNILLEQIYANKFKNYN